MKKYNPPADHPRFYEALDYVDNLIDSRTKDDALYMSRTSRCDHYIRNWHWLIINNHRAAGIVKYRGEGNKIMKVYSFRYNFLSKKGYVFKNLNYKEQEIQDAR